MQRNWMCILWPSFLAAGMAEAVFFALFDPEELALFWRDAVFSRTAAYSVAFFVFWSFAALSSSLTSLLQRSREEINRCPLPPGDRPNGCPKKAIDTGE